ncbi:hypothetical protein AB0K40_18095 [Nonomuraea bangladeshensis]|uniref:XRE family transcriptional regulator n=1 Tax=Nonomuraea bangladeshensis TaxID=404385 RepID=A0ABV3H4H1_9ACTN
MPPRDIDDTASEQPLSDYVQAYLDRTGLSRRQFASQCRDPETGQTLNHTYVGDLVGNRVPRAPEMWRLRALAAGIAGDTVTESMSDYRRRVEEMQRMAAIQWLDLGEVLRVNTGEGGWVTLSVPADWSDRRRARFIRLAEQLARDLDEED